MCLHRNTEYFGEIIHEVGGAYSIPYGIIEKDYYVFMALKNIVSKLGRDNVVFKGGTSLSKAYGIIQRFSEDVDLCLPGNIMKNSRAKTNLVDAILQSMSDLGLELIETGKIQHRGVYNNIQGRYKSIINKATVVPYIKFETAHRIEEFPIEIKSIDSYLGKYLAERLGKDAITSMYMEPFDVYTVSIYRTFIDKLYAIGDYFIANKNNGYSRHLYDVYKIICLIDWNNSQLLSFLKTLLQKVQICRQVSRACLSAQPEVSLKQVLYDALISDFYKDDYENVTKTILFEDITYDDCKKIILNMLTSNLLM